MAAMGKRRELGLGNELPWHLPDELKRFRDITRGHTVIMGRKTYESIGKALPERKNIVVTRNADYHAPGAVVVGSIGDAFKEAGREASSGEVFVIGGGEIFGLALPYTDKMYLTFVDAEIPADTYFPEFNKDEWRVTETVPHEADEQHQYGFTFTTYERKK